LIADLNKSSALGGSPIPSALPTRVITYAWGEHYLDILLSLTIPALLAPGNLPYVAASTSCELVILTEERFFAAVAAHASVMRAKQLCLVRLIALDDLISRKDAYGMALTHALHRGFSDLGPAMTDSWHLFLNADFVLAEGSLRLKTTAPLCQYFSFGWRQPEFSRKSITRLIGNMCQLPTGREDIRRSCSVLKPM